MKDFAECYGEWALIAGAAEGIGAAFTEALAGKKLNIIMVDIKQSSMEELAARMEKVHGIHTMQLMLDLSYEESWMRCMKIIEDLDCRLLIYIPAYSPVKLFLDTTQEEVDHYINLNCRTPVKLMLEFGKKLKNNRHGGIILMSSLAGLIGPQFTAPYAASKAFTNILGEALHSEFKRFNIDVLVCCAGPTLTPTYMSSLPVPRRKNSNVLDPGYVAAFALKNLGKKAICIPGWKNRLTYYFLTRLLPRETAVSIIDQAMIKRYPQVYP